MSTHPSKTSSSSSSSGSSCDSSRVLEEPVLRHFLRRISSTGTRDISRKNETEDGEYFEETDVNKTEVQDNSGSSLARLSLTWWFWVSFAGGVLLIITCCKCLNDSRERKFNKLFEGMWG